MELCGTRFRQRGDTWELLSDTNKLREAISELCKACSEHLETKSKLNGNILEHLRKPVGAPQNHFEAPQRQLWALRGHNGPIRIDFGYPRWRFGAPRSKTTTPLTHFAAPRNNKEAPRSHFKAPRRHLRVPHGYNWDSLSNLELREVNSECRGTKSELQGDALELRKTTSELLGTSLY